VGICRLVQISTRDGKHLKHKKIFITKFASTWCLIACNIIIIIIIVIIIIIIITNFLSYESRSCDEFFPARRFYQIQ